MILVDSGVWIDYFNGNDTDEVKIRFIFRQLFYRYR